MDQLLTTTDAREILDVPVSTFRWWVKNRGVVMPKLPGKGKGSTNIFTVQQVWAIGIAKSVKAGGHGTEVACEIAGVLQALTPKEIETEFAKGNTCLLVVNVGGDLKVMPKLLSPDAITKNKHLIEVRKSAEKEKVSFQWYGIDTKPMFDQIVSAAKKRTLGR